MEKVKKRAFKGGQRMPYMIPNFHAFCWSLAILSYICGQKAALSQEYSEMEKSVKSKFDQFNI